MNLIPHPYRLLLSFVFIAICLLVSLIRDRQPVGARDALTTRLELAGLITAVIGILIMISAVLP